MSAESVFVKLCGLREITAARVGVEAGADALGFILAPSKRQVQPDAIRDIRQQLTREFDAIPPLVGVVVNGTPEELARLVHESGVDMIQLSGDETADILPDIDVPVIKAFRFDARTTLDQALGQIDPWVSAANPVQFVHVEGHAEGSYGGSGSRVDWLLVRGIAERYPVILAGGLDPWNVAEAVTTVRPFGVDVSSGTETEGAKDPEKLRAFVVNARTPGYSGSRAQK